MSFNNGFSLPSADFDPLNNQAIRDYYKKKEDEGVLSGDPGVEDEIEAEAKQVVEEWEAAIGRKATQEEQDKIMTKIRRIRAGAWLEGIKKELAGKTTVPIAYFNRLAEENERSIAFLSHRMVGMAYERNKIAKEVHDLQDKNARLATLLKIEEEEKIEFQDKSTKLADENAKIQQDNNHLRDELDKAVQEAKKSEEMAINTLKQLEEANNNLKEENDNLAQYNIEAEEEIKLLNIDLIEQAKRDEKAAKGALDDCKQDKFNIEEEKAKVEEEARKDEESSDKNIKSLEEQLNKCREDLAAAMNDLQDDRAAMLKLSYDQDELIINYNKLKNDFDELKKEKDDKDKNPAQASNCWDTAKILKELKEAKEKDEDISQEVQDLIDRWLRRVAEVNDRREFYNAMEDLQRRFQELQDRIRAIYTLVGFEGDKFTAAEVLDNLEAELKKQPKNDMKLRLWCLKLAMDVHHETQKLVIEKLRVDDLRMKLDLSMTDDALSAECMMRYGLYEEEEIERRVDSRTQTYRIHRRELLDHLFAAANDLKTAAIRCPDNATRIRINEICEEHLSPLVLPAPKVQPSRRR
ncbi:hypothetical protein F5B19DRAFT_496351 [Rostrohypoxylon terebratum]|nr:hypothetical protein F5B19DRAFT_496351 [Rostrohypoxylon terebratum]